MKVTAKTSTPAGQIIKARQLAEDMKNVPADGPVAQRITRQYNELINTIGYDPIS
jgi:hypothetical protein